MNSNFAIKYKERNSEIRLEKPNSDFAWPVLENNPTVDCDFQILNSLNNVNISSILEEL